MTVYDRILTHGLTRIDPERAHHLGFRAIRAGARLLPTPLGRPVEAMGLTFPHALGLAAGFDKNAVGIDALASLGFGHVEVGTVTALPQPGNPRPRLFRLPRDRAIVNRMGFNNDGAEVVAQRLAAWRVGHPAMVAGPSAGGAWQDRRSADGAWQDRRTSSLGPPVLGVNIGKTKLVPEEEAGRDYDTSARLLAPYADYLVVNVSSPNTPGLRDLQAVDKLEPLLATVRRAADEATGDLGRRVPLLVKIAPDLDDDDVLASADLALATGLDGMITTNTTISRADLVTPGAEVAALGAGGLSGPPLRERALEVTRMVRARVGPELTVIGVGGITTVDDARARLAAGADLVQAYTALVYEGPRWPARIVRGLAGG